MIRADARQFDLFAAPAPPPVPAALDARPSLGSARLQAVRDEWERFKAQTERAAAICPPVTLEWGKPRDKHFLVQLLNVEGAWHYRTDYWMPNTGGCGPYSRETFASLDDATAHVMRAQLARVAQHLAVYGDGGPWSGSYGRDADWNALAKWCIAQVPSGLFGGADLGAEFAAMKAEAVKNETARRAQLRRDHEQKQAAK